MHPVEARNCITSRSHAGRLTAMETAFEDPLSICTSRIHDLRTAKRKASVEIDALEAEKLAVLESIKIIHLELAYKTETVSKKLQQSCPDHLCQSPVRTPNHCRWRGEPMSWPHLNLRLRKCNCLWTKLWHRWKVRQLCSVDTCNG